MLAERLVRQLADPYRANSFGGRARARRFEWMLDWFPTFGQMRVVDLGGDTRFWRSVRVRPRHVTIVDINAWALEHPESWMSTIQGDACDRRTITGEFDLVFSNSVIEHVGGPRLRRGFAETVADLAPRHWVQTPYRYFPLEPHFLFPLFQFLPPAGKVLVSKHWALASRRGRTDTDHVEYVMDHELLSRTELRALFPTSQIATERFLGLTKSLIAIQSETPAKLGQ